MSAAEEEIPAPRGRASSAALAPCFLSPLDGHVGDAFPDRGLSSRSPPRPSRRPLAAAASTRRRPPRPTARSRGCRHPADAAGASPPLPLRAGNDPSSIAPRHRPSRGARPRRSASPAARSAGEVKSPGLRRKTQLPPGGAKGGESALTRRGGGS